MIESQKKPAETSGAVRQRLRRERLREQNASTVAALLTEEQNQKMKFLLAVGYAPDKSSVLARGLDEVFDRETNLRSGTKMENRR